MYKAGEITKTSLKYKIGLTLIAISCVMPFFALIVPFMGLPSTIAAFATGILIIGCPELLFFVGVFLAGKEAVQLVKNKLWKPAGKIRYRCGLFVFAVCILANWVCAYIEVTDVISVCLNTQLYVMGTFDIMLIISLLIMGPEFFIKFRRIFTWEGENALDKYRS